MAAALAPAVLAALVELAAVDVDVALRVEGRSSTVAVSGAPGATRAAASATPAVTAAAQGRGLRLSASYAPRLWSSDLEARPSPLVNHAVEARLEAQGERAWRAAATAAALRGRTDPIADLLRAAPSSPGEVQVAATEALRYEALWASLGGELRLGPRTAASATAGWRGSRALGADAGALPPQHGPTLDAAVTRAVSERDALRVSTSSAWTATGAGASRADTASTTALASWRRRLTAYAEGWLGGGAALLYSDPPAPGSKLAVQPAGEIGAALGGAGSRVRGALAGRATPAVDRFTGDAGPALDLSSTVSWQAAERLTLSAAAAAGTRTDRETSLARADGRAAWAIGPSLLVAAGFTWTWQHERDPSRVSFRETGAYVSIAWTRGLLGAAPPAGAWPAAAPPPSASP